MNEFLEFYFNAFFITIPLTIYLIVLITRGIKELLDLLLNKESIDDLIEKADNISFEKLERDIELYSGKLQSKYPWTSDHFNAFLKKKELEKQLNSPLNKLAYKNISGERNKIENLTRQYEADYWISAFGAKKSEYELAREMRLRKLFNP